MADQANPSPDQQTQPTGNNTPQANVPGQQAQQPPSQQPQTPQNPPAQQQQPRADDWHNRYNGLQQVHQQTVEQLRQAQALLQQNQQHAGTLEQQLQQANEQQGQLSQNYEQLQQQAAAAQSENAFWNLVSTEYQDLLPLANVLQRNDDPDVQRQILNTARQTVGAQIQQQTQAGLRAAFAGATPGATPPAGGMPGQEPSYEEVMEHVMDDNLARTNPQEHERWMEIYRNHSQMNYESLGLGPFVDPTPNHYQTRAQMLGQQQQSDNPRQQAAPQAPDLAPNDPSSYNPFLQGGGQG
jgi:hypothetical protein